MPASRSAARCSTAPAILLLVLALGACRERPPAAWLQPASTAPPGASTPAAKAPPFVSCEATPVSELIRVDQFGYRPAARKVAVLSEPVEGWNANTRWKPGPVYE